MKPPGKKFEAEQRRSSIPFGLKANEHRKRGEGDEYNEESLTEFENEIINGAEELDEAALEEEELNKMLNGVGI